ncbi:RhoGAP-domain-containing protein [Neolentinus lepideus HHB14362 ss-1]|uniref:RhoGAP-domain-containing protein n=1 Tax=Neolentinus lepideus HHB14362 ss-1 TaxID=1314782 RepID=A0A165NP32_9AGAM|nr:RhoGAP-domain-containing protein [Neolentinus lepideus HHB14362 ss-1]
MGPSQHQAATSSDVPTSQSSSSLSSSFSSSAASSMLMHAAPPSDSSQSDIASPDISASPTTPSSKKRFFSTPTIFSPQPRSSSLAGMGQALSKGQPTSSGGPNSRSVSPDAPSSAGQKLKRAFAGRRKKTAEVSPASSSVKMPASRGKERAADLSPPSIAPSSSNDSRLQYRTQPLRLPSGAKQMTLQLATSTLQVFSNRRGLLSSKSSPLPPPLPPKPPGMAVSRSTPTTSPPPVPPINTSHSASSTSPPTKQDHRSSVIPTSPSIVPALDFLRASDNAVAEEPRPRERRDPEKESEKEIWRRSDSTMASHSTIRPGAGSRSPRPLSIAESLQSTSTVMAVNKRLSSIITDADYATPEEDVSDDSEPHAAPAPRATTPPPSTKARHRRSVSLTLGSPFQLKPKSPAGGELSRTPEFEVDAPSFSGRSFTEPKTLPPARDSPGFNKASATGFISPMRNHDSLAPPDPSFKGRLVAWNTTSSSASGRGFDPSPEPSAEKRTTSDAQTSQSVRQTAISMTSGFAPAAFGFGKRAVEKMGRAWGGLTSSSSSGYSSSSSTAPSSFSSGKGGDFHPLGRVHSNQSVSSQSNASGSFPGKLKQRRTPNAPSATWSISSSATSSSVSGEEGFAATPSGPTLGKRLRGPLRMISGSGAVSGLVFGRDLKSCVRETAVDSGRWDLGDNDHASPGHRRQMTRRLDREAVGEKALEDRMVPALVVRCAQHLLRWGIEEEGLFRISGRSSHINKLRAEFDTGADYDISACSPGDLDPHAVASIFKAYLRELPEPILTHALIPYFDAAMTAENNARSAEESEVRVQRTSRGGGLPSGPKNGSPGLRKPPSLSTLAMPNFSGIRPPSQPLLKALSSLISRLPTENCDLLRTVTELIKETAKRHKDTKMPLSNLLLVFCPSLSMGPPLLRVLCEAECIWDGPLKDAEDPHVIDIRADPSPVIDIQRREDEDDAVGSDGEDVDVAETSAGAEPSARETKDEGEDKSDTEGDAVMHFPLVAKRRIMRPAVSSAVRSPSPLKASSLAPSQIDSIYASAITPSDSASYQDDAASYVSASDVPSSGASEHLYNPNSPPALTSSADSLATPSTMSEDPMLPRALPVDYDIAQDKAFSSFSQPSSPKIADSSNLPLPPSHGRIGTGSPVPFPSELEMAARPSLDRSRPVALSLVDVGRGREDHFRSASTAGTPLPRVPRVKKPSLHLLFTKRKSGSPIASPSRQSGLSPYLHTAATSSSSISMPGTAVTAPQTSTSSLPPKLDLSIESSPIKFDNPSSDEANVNEDQSPGLVSPESSESTATATHAVYPMQARTLSSISSSTYESSRSHETPIADLYCQDSNKSSLSVKAPSVADTPVTATEPVATQASPPDTKHQYSIYVNEDSEEDWAGCVLKAAEAGNVATESS